MAFDSLDASFGAFDVSLEVLEFDGLPRDDAWDILVVGTLAFDPLLRPDFVGFPTDLGVLLLTELGLSPFVVFLFAELTPAAFLFVALGTPALDAGLPADVALALAAFAAAFFLK